jgi:hypothetical protein
VDILSCLTQVASLGNPRILKKLESLTIKPPGLNSAPIILKGSPGHCSSSSWQTHVRSSSLPNSSDTLIRAPRQVCSGLFSIVKAGSSVCVPICDNAGAAFANDEGGFALHSFTRGAACLCGLFSSTRRASSSIKSSNKPEIERRLRPASSAAFFLKSPRTVRSRRSFFLIS